MSKKIGNAIATTISESKLVLSFDNGKEGVISIDTSTLSDAIRHAAMMHGLKQKLVDAAAIARDVETGRSATTADKYEAVLKVAERLKAGEWNATATRGEGTGTGGLLYRALMRLYPDMGDTRVKAFLESKTDAEKAALRGTAKVAGVIEAIRAESGKAKVIDTDALLGELDGE